MLSFCCPDNLAQLMGFRLIIKKTELMRLQDALYGLNLNHHKIWIVIIGSQGGATNSYVVRLLT